MLSESPNTLCAAVQPVLSTKYYNNYSYVGIAFKVTITTEIWAWDDFSLIARIPQELQLFHGLKYTTQ